MMYVQTLKQGILLHKKMLKSKKNKKKNPAHMASASITQKWKPARVKKKGRKIPT